MLLPYLRRCLQAGHGTGQADVDEHEVGAELARLLDGLRSAARDGHHGMAPTNETLFQIRAEDMPFFPYVPRDSGNVTANAVP
jgi:hypothetical protein